MIRTQIYLTQKQHRVLKSRALKQSSTISQVVRNIIDTKIMNGDEVVIQKKKPNVGKWLMDIAQEAEKLGAKGPADLASNVDKYLYGEKV